MEMGPWRIDGHGGLKTVEGGWEEYTTMVYSADWRSLWFYSSLTPLQSINPQGQGCHILVQTTTYIHYKRYSFPLDPLFPAAADSPV